MGDMMPLSVNPEIEMFALDDGTATRVVCEVPDSPSGGGGRYALSEQAVRALQSMPVCDDVDHLVAHLMAHEPAWPSEQVRQWVTQDLLPRRLIVPLGADAGVTPPRPRASYLTFRSALLPAPLVAAVTRHFTWLFRRRVAVAIVTISVVVQLWALVAVVPAHLNLGALTGWDIVIIMLATTVVGLIHEFGHATAMASFGLPNVAIGWGLYLHIRVLYADLSGAWRLKRLQRAVVDLGGVYFHAICLGVLGAVLLVGANRLTSAVFVALVLQAVSALNPFLRMDGYWLVSDLWGIFDLQARIKLLVANILRGRPTDVVWPAGRPRPLLYGYCISSIAVYTCLIVVVLRQTIFSVVPSLPGHIAAVAAGAELIAVSGKGILIYACAALLLKAARTCMRLLQAPYASVTP
jgi:putative peptide zinc metalloprotease protein